MAMRDDRQPGLGRPIPGGSSGPEKAGLPAPEALPERHARYCWARGLVAGRKVLDAGCGAGWGTALLATHAREAVGIDHLPFAIADARRESANRASFRQGDLQQLPFADDEFDVVVCFEAIAQVADPELVFDELARVLRPNGLLLVSSPNRGAYPPGNPLHLSELTSDELETSLASRFSNVVMLRQQTYYASLLGTAATLETDDLEIRIDADVRKGAGGGPGGELYAIAVASNGGLPPEPARIVLGDSVDHSEQRRQTEAWQRRCVRAEAEAMAMRLELDYVRRLQDAALERSTTDSPPPMPES